MNVMLWQTGTVGAAIVRRATLLMVAEWTQRAGESSEATICGMGEAIGQHLELAVNQTAAAQQHQGLELRALQEGVHGRLSFQEGAILAISAGLEGVRLWAEMQAMELGKMEAAIEGSWQQVEQRIKEEMDRGMEHFGKHLAERDAHFSEANQRLADEAELAGAVESELDVATQNPVRSVKLLSVIFNLTDAVVVRCVGLPLGRRTGPCHVNGGHFPSAVRIR